MTVDKTVMKQMVYQLGRCQGYRKQHQVRKLYDEGKGHGMGEAHPDPDVQELVPVAVASEFYLGFEHGVGEYEGTL